MSRISVRNAAIVFASIAAALAGVALVMARTVSVTGSVGTDKPLESKPRSGSEWDDDPPLMGAATSSPGASSQ